jgi:hypothetical protein
MLISRLKRIRLGSQGRGVTGSTADFGHRAQRGRRKVWVQFPPALLDAGA